jgi:hypothetical protein
MSKRKTSDKNKSTAEVYKLSENSKKANHEFAEMNTTFSLFRSRFTQVMEQAWDKKKTDRFKKKILDTIRSGPVELMGSRKVCDGDLGILENFHLNHKATAGNLFREELKITADLVKGIAIAIKPFEYQVAFAKAHPKALIAEVRIYVFSFDLLTKSSEGKSMVLLRMKRNEDMPEPLSINFPLANNRLTMLVSKVSFRSGENLTDIQDRQYIGATVEKCILVKDGNIINYQKIIPEQGDKPERPTGEWEELD